MLLQKEIVFNTCSRGNGALTLLAIDAPLKYMMFGFVLLTMVILKFEHVYAQARYDFSKEPNNGSHVFNISKASGSNIFTIRKVTVCHSADWTTRDALIVEVDLEIYNKGSDTFRILPESFQLIGDNGFRTEPATEKLPIDLRKMQKKTIELNYTLPKEQFNANLKIASKENKFFAELEIKDILWPRDIRK